MKKNWVLSIVVVLSIAVIAGGAWLAPSINHAHANAKLVSRAATNTCGTIHNPFDISGTWDLNYTLDTFSGPYTLHQTLTFVKQADGSFLANSEAMGNVSAVAFSIMRAPTTSGDVCLLTSVAINQDGPTYHAVWSGFEYYDISGAHPVDTGTVVGEWSSLTLQRGLFQLQPHTS